MFQCNKVLVSLLSWNIHNVIKRWRLTGYNLINFSRHYDVETAYKSSSNSRYRLHRESLVTVSLVGLNTNLFIYNLIRNNCFWWLDGLNNCESLGLYLFPFQTVDMNANSLIHSCEIKYVISIAYDILRLIS